MIAEWITAVGALMTGVGAFATARQVRLAERQARTTFEDSMAREYRALAHQLPAAALLGEPLDEPAMNASMDEFLHYIDLSNEQVFLRTQGRISDATWFNWRDGIQSNLQRPAFRDAWVVIKKRADRGFDELRRLEASHFRDDPKLWR